MSKRAMLEGPSRLTQALQHLRTKPSLELSPTVRGLRIKYAFRNDHFGARYFVRESLPRIRYANPKLDVKIERLKKTIEDQWEPELEVIFSTGPKKMINPQGKQSSEILEELMSIAGGPQWLEWKAEHAKERKKRTAS
ncbi:hypothetical protein FISHEDRAFT_69395 [Fistulina hepatica ATCC 64428]|uniref:Ribosomal protein/NADH dehydrogenase domain-containing protein n=1 Tax=Fistulina hepatica ATCC 64428 TaxID=1128425 RepID=A0A0D7AQ63_9AGAR|nr:hypothetical protein FISHEDRAFT_69395 [Fistulina hepatica ATCC 64428]